MPFLRKAAGVLLASAAGPAIVWQVYSRNSKFVPFNRSSDDFPTRAFLKVNPDDNEPALVDHCVRKIPLSKLVTTDVGELTTSFSRNIWAGNGFEIQRRLLEKNNRALEGRQDDLWDKPELASSNYELGTKIADHFEVIDRDEGRVRYPSSLIDRSNRYRLL